MSDVTPEQFFTVCRITPEYPEATPHSCLMVNCYASSHRYPAYHAHAADKPEAINVVAWPVVKGAGLSISLCDHHFMLLKKAVNQHAQLEGITFPEDRCIELQSSDGAAEDN